MRAPTRSRQLSTRLPKTIERSPRRDPDTLTVQECSLSAKVVRCDPDPKWLDVVGTRRSDGSTEPSSYQAPGVGPGPEQYALAGDAPLAGPGIRRWMFDASLVGIAARPVWLLRRPDLTAGKWAKLVRSDGRPA